MPERREIDKMLRGLTPKHQRQLSVSSSNALERFAVMEAVLQHRKLVLLLDYDGTLTPIVKDPSKALLSERARAVLTELPKHFITGVVSGRSLGKIRNFVGVKGLFYAGSHGFDILAPSHSAYSGSLGLNRARDSSSPTGLPTPPPSSSSSSSPPSACCDTGPASAPAPAPPAPVGGVGGAKDAAADGGGAGAEGAAACNGAATAAGNGAAKAAAAGGSGGNGVAEVASGLAALWPAASGGGGTAAAVEKESEEDLDVDESCHVLEEVRHQVAQEYLPVMEKIRDELKAELKDINKSEVEDNRFSVSIHYRNCARADVPRVKEVVERVQARHERIRMGSGKEVFELQPDIAWDKGKAVLWLLDKLVFPMSLEPAGGSDATTAAAINGGAGGASGQSSRVAAGSTDVAAAAAAALAANGAAGEEDEDEDEDEGSGRFFTIFIGDDKTDENAFRVLNGDMGEGQAFRHDGVGILVSEESRETNAAYTLRNPDEVALFLEKIAELGRDRRRSGSGASRR